MTHRIAQARSRIERLSPDQLARELASGVTLVDVREADELVMTGIITGSLHIPRGILEFAADPSSPRHLPVLTPPRRLILVCSNGYRSSLAAESLHELGFRDVAHLEGGIAAWTAQGLPLEPCRLPGCSASKESQS